MSIEKRRQLIGSGLLITAILCSATCFPTFADSLVLLDGQIIETKGPWTVDGRRVTYTALNGTFSALRTSLVDLDKSRALTEQRLKPPTESSVRAEPPVVGLVVRQGDIKRADTSTAAVPEPASGASVPSGSIGVLDWREELVREGSKIVGTLRNATDSTYLSLRLDVTLIAENGDALATRAADLVSRRADPQTNVSFEAVFPDVFSFTNASFTVSGSPYENTGSATQSDTSDETPEETASTPPAATESTEPPR